MATAYFFLLEFNIFSGRKLQSWGAARKTASEKIWAKCEEKAFLRFRTMPQLTERLEEANLFLVTHVSITFRSKSFSGRV